MTTLRRAARNVRSPISPGAGWSRLLSSALSVVSAGVLLAGVAPPVRATPGVPGIPGIPDIDSLTDDSGPVPDEKHSWEPDLVFRTPSGLTCKKSLTKVVWEVVCAGDFAGAPPGTRVVTLSYAGGQSLGPGQFRPTPPERFFSDDEARGAVLLPEGHKMRFFAYANGHTLVCGVPPQADVVCVMQDGRTANGFVIGNPSRVF